MAVRGRRGTLVKLFERIENVFRRLDNYIELEQTPGMTDAIVKVLAEVLCILAVATKEIKENRASKLITSDIPVFLAYCSSESFVKRLAGRSDIEDALQRLETVIVEEVRMAATEALKGLHDVKKSFKNVEGMLQGFGDMLQDVDERVKDIGLEVSDSEQTMVQLVISAILIIYTDTRC